MSQRFLLIGLDGYESRIADSLIAEGKLPNLKRVMETSACFDLEHGTARRTGLAFEHISSGLSPADGDRWSAASFDKENYQVRQEETRFTPFVAGIKAQTVVFDTPYFDLDKAENVNGIVAWGAHDPGTKQDSRPSGLIDELKERFGVYPAKEWIYGFAWPSPEKCHTMGRALCEAVDQRSRISRWLFGTRFTEWRLGIVVISELHSAAEALWHGFDPAHPLHQLPSAKPAGEALVNVYVAVDKMLGDLYREFPDAISICFSMHGMGTNESDVASMALLPELLYRKEFSRPLLHVPPGWRRDPSGIPSLEESETWRISLHHTDVAASIKSNIVNTIRPLLNSTLRKYFVALSHRSDNLAWMPAAQYQPYWSSMKAFALPAFYDGRIRINLQNRESQGIVPLDQYYNFRASLAEFLEKCINPNTGQPVVRRIDYCEQEDPRELEASNADMIVIWSEAQLAIEHPELGRIGPLPYRRTGGHTGGCGFAMFTGEDISPGACGMHSAFDLVPTLCDLMGEHPPWQLSGKSFAGEFFTR